MKTKKIIKALRIIKKYCNKKIDCDSCPFYDKNIEDCCLMEADMKYPAQWNVKQIKANLKGKERLD